MALWGRAGREAAVCHAECGVCASVARGRDKAREGESESGQSSRLPREDAPSWHEPGCVPFLPRHLPQRHASSRRLRHRPRAHHRLLPRHRQRQRMFDVPPRHQPRGTVIKTVLRGGLFCCLSARSVRRLYMPVFLFFARSVSLHEIIVPLRLRKWGKEKIPHFCIPSISFQPPLIFLLIGYPCATLGLLLPVG